MLSRPWMVIVLIIGGVKKQKHQRHRDMQASRAMDAQNDKLKVEALETVAD
jgi:hypothetical protein